MKKPSADIVDENGNPVGTIYQFPDGSFDYSEVAEFLKHSKGYAKKLYDRAGENHLTGKVTIERNWKETQ